MIWEVLKLKVKAKVLVVQSCPTLCSPKNCNPPVSSAHGILRARSSHSLLQEIFPTQGSNLGLLHCRQILYHLSHQGSPSNWGVAENHWKDVLKYRLAGPTPQSFSSCKSRLIPKNLHLSNKFLSDVDAAGPRTTSWEPSEK